MSNPHITPPHPAKELLARYAATFRAAWQHRHELAGPRRLTDELAFLPAHLSLQETPVHPAPRRAAIAICALFVIALAWSILGEIDIVAVANGRIVVSDRTKTIQPLATSVIKAIHVRDGDEVKAGQILIELDATDAVADTNRVAQEYDAAYAEGLRTAILMAALNGNGHGPRWPEQSRLGTDADSQAKEQLSSEWNDIRAKLDKLQAELQHREAEVATAEAQVLKLQTTLPLVRQRETDFAALTQQGFVAGHAGQDRTRERIELERDLATALAHRQEARAARTESEQNRMAYKAETVRNLRERHNDAELKQQQLTQEGDKAHQRVALTQLTAPADGTIQQLAVHTTGGVVTPAQALMVLVPKDAHLSAELLLENKDIGFVHEGQDATIKVEAFPYTRFGTLPATVSRVSTDAITSDRSNVQADATNNDNSRNGLNPPVYSIMVAMQKETLSSEGRKHKLAPGMSVTAEIKTGHRRVIDYLLSPLESAIHESFGER